MEENNFSQIKKAINLHHQITQKSDPRDFYRVDRHRASEYLKIPSWKEKIFQYFRDVRDLGEEIVYVDVCGRAGGKTIGADKSYCFSLKTDDHRKILQDEGDIFFDGDLFNSKDFSEFLALIEEGGTPPSLVTFEPIVGLQDYTPFSHQKISSLYEEVTYGQLGKRLESLIDILRPGGFIHLGVPFQFHGRNLAINYNVFDQSSSESDSLVYSGLKKMAEGSKWSVKGCYCCFDDFFLIRKYKNSLARI